MNLIALLPARTASCLPADLRAVTLAKLQTLTALVAADKLDPYIAQATAVSIVNAAYEAYPEYPVETEARRRFIWGYLDGAHLGRLNREPHWPRGQHFDALYEYAFWNGHATGPTQEEAEDDAQLAWEYYEQQRVVVL